jgi:hypothetical protein
MKKLEILTRHCVERRTGDENVPLSICVEGGYTEDIAANSQAQRSCSVRVKDPHVILRPIMKCKWHQYRMQEDIVFHSIIWLYQSSTRMTIMRNTAGCHIHRGYPSSAPWYYIIKRNERAPASSQLTWCPTCMSSIAFRVKRRTSHLQVQVQSLGTTLHARPSCRCKLSVITGY